MRRKIAMMSRKEQRVLHHCDEQLCLVHVIALALQALWSFLLPLLVGNNVLVEKD